MANQRQNQDNTETYKHTQRYSHRDLDTQTKLHTAVVKNKEANEKIKTMSYFDHVYWLWALIIGIAVP